MITTEDIQAAAKRLENVVKHTPLEFNEQLSTNKKFQQVIRKI